MAYFCYQCNKITETVVIIAAEQVRAGDAEAERFTQICPACFKKKHSKKIEIH